MLPMVERVRGTHRALLFPPFAICFDPVGPASHPSEPKISTALSPPRTIFPVPLAG
jgi:hypothetical protein